MSSDRKNPLDWLVEAAWTVFGACVLLWLAVCLLSQIWVWLLVIGGVIVVGGGAVWFLRWRRDRW